MPTAQDFQKEMDKIFATATKQGRSYVDVKSGDLHRKVGDYPGPNHRMPLCCSVMRQNMKSGDQVLQKPPSGQGASLVIRYKLSR